MNKPHLNTQERVKKVVKPSIARTPLLLFISVAINFKPVKRYCIDYFGHRITLDSYWCLLLLGCFGSRGVTSMGLHDMFNISFNTVVLRNTQRRLSVLVKCGLVVSTRVNNSVKYSLSFQAEKLLFSGIDKDDLLELSAMVKSIQDEDKAKMKPKRKKIAKSAVKPSK